MPASRDCLNFESDNVCKATDSVDAVSFLSPDLSTAFTHVSRALTPAALVVTLTSILKIWVLNSRKPMRVWWCMLLILAFGEAEAGGSL